MKSKQKELSIFVKLFNLEAADLIIDRQSNKELQPASPLELYKLYLGPETV